MRIFSIFTSLLCKQLGLVTEALETVCVHDGDEHCRDVQLLADPVTDACGRAVHLLQKLAYIQMVVFVSGEMLFMTIKFCIKSFYLNRFQFNNNFACLCWSFIC